MLIKNIKHEAYEFVTTNLLLKIIALTLSLTLYSFQYINKKNNLKNNAIQEHQNIKTKISK